MKRSLSFTGTPPRNIGAYHCETYIASLLALRDVGDWKEKMSVSKQEITDIQQLLDQLKVNHIFTGMHCLNIHRFKRQDCRFAIGVSKRCCPVCIFVLQQLNKLELHGTKFVISDGHTNITPCALPGWLPEDVVREVVLKFSNSLREELGRLQSLSQRIVAS